MPRYEFDPSKASATIEIFPKDRYLMKIGTPKSFLRMESNNGVDSVKNYGIRFALTHQEGQFNGKTTIFNGYLHNDGSQSMIKRFQMAALGYKNTPEEEKRFDAEQAGRDWSFDPDTGGVGEAWQQFAGASIYAHLDVGKNKNTDEPSQDFKRWEPIAPSA